MKKKKVKKKVNLAKYNSDNIKEWAKKYNPPKYKGSYL